MPFSDCTALQSEGYRDWPMRTQRMIDTMLPIKQSVMKPPINHINSLEFAIRKIRRPK